MEWKAFVGEDEVIRMNAELAMNRDFTLKDIENLPDGVRAEVIDGQIFYFAAPSEIHQRLLGNLYFRVREYVKMNAGACKVYVAPFAVRLIEDEKNYMEPDMVIICDRDKIKEDGCHGTPDFIIEVISKSTKARDYGLKTMKYREAGVKEYWIVDPIREIVLTYWFEDETLNTIYGINDEIESRLFVGLKINVMEE